ncbi:NACHT, LRR and PYD domains-containing protein 3-like [Malaclemys terrapin pileata]|uniref:NACHT, LRR and PYD domains-containing protein 3-like n=1 Tax=Malaclemys terrapin pileata TaxID=2991368 RepID=UPI0023A8E6B1|nr:NACHT, LRR and PYD domains-containing protein 3-like [Malaclemys terrapin pileata]
MENQSRISDLLQSALDDLLEEDFKRFKDKLSHSGFKGKGTIPRGRLEKADRIDTKNILIAFYGGDAAVDVTIEILVKINVRGSADNLKKYREKVFSKEKEKTEKFEEETRGNNRRWDLGPCTEIHHAKEQGEDHPSLKGSDYQKKYREQIQEEYQIIEDRNARLGEYVSLNNRYTKLLIVKEHRQREEKEHEIITRGRRHAELMAQQTSHTKISVLFDPGRNREIPRTVVLQGAAGIGKTMTARKIMLDWAAGKLYQKKFDYVFYINCREINRVNAEQSVADLLLNNFPDGVRPIKEIFKKPEKLLFVIDGFDELSSLLNIDEVSLCTDPFEKKPVETILCSLLRKKVLQKSFLLITTRPTALEKLKQNLRFPCYAEIMGFSGEDRKEYFHKFFCDENKATQAFNFVKENEMLFTMCFVPIVCWIICTVMKQQMERGEDLAQTSKTTTSVYLLFLTNLLTGHLTGSIQKSKSNLWKLCSLAADGILKQKILFEEGDLKEHNLSLSNIQSLFLIKSIFQKDTECESVYSFIHLTFQEFFAALFYVLEEDKETKKKVNHLLKTYGTSKNKYLMLTVRFLFGLLNKERRNDIEKMLNFKTTPKIKRDLLKWFEAEAKNISSLPYKTHEEVCDQLELFHCLYENQEEEFAKRAMDNFQEIRLEHIRLTTMDEIALSFCVKNCCSKQSLYLCNCTLGIGEQEEGWRAKLRKRLFPLHPHIKDPRTSTAYSLLQGLKDPNCKLKAIFLSSCKLSSAFPEDLSPKILFTNRSLEKLDLSANTLGDSGLKHLCEGLKHPQCNLQTLLLWQCSLTAVCCGDLSAALSTNQSLTELELSGNKLGDSGIKLLCQGLKHPSCKLQKLVVWDCHLTDACCGDLSSLLSTNQSLRELNLSSNKLSYSGVKLLCEGLKHPNCKLEKLNLSEIHIDEITTKELEVLQKIKPGLLIVYNAAFSHQNPGTRTRRMECLLSQCHTFICRLTSWSSEMMWNIFVMHCQEVGLVLLLIIATYWLH